jgi:hypothetical protein
MNDIKHKAACKSAQAAKPADRADVLQRLLPQAAQARHRSCDVKREQRCDGDEFRHERSSPQLLKRVRVGGMQPGESGDGGTRDDVAHDAAGDDGPVAVA